MPGRPKTHPETTPAHPNRLSERAIDLLRRVVDKASKHESLAIYKDNEPHSIVQALLRRGLIEFYPGPYFGDLIISSTGAGRALIEKINGKAK